MATAAAAETIQATAAATPKKGKKKLIIIVAAALLVLLGAAGGTAAWMAKKRAAAEAAAQEEDDGEKAGAAHKKKAAHAAAPIFLPLDPFVVNLADKEVDRFAQVGITLELEDAKLGEQIKLYMPAIRNGILMVLAHKNSQELLERAGKEALAQEIKRETLRPLDLESTDADNAPVRKVHFSSFIIQ